jgi:eukaryotic-like serine/threonine-protein kinase
MNTANGDRNLLFGILALQMDFISRDVLVQAMHTWVLDKAKPLSQILVEQGALSAARCAMLEPLVQEHIRQHGDDAGKSLAAVSSVGSACDMLKQIADPDVQASLANLPAADPNATKYPSAGAASAVGHRFLILRPHAEGGLGKVSVAHDGELNREVALKEIQERHADHPDSRARFLVEAEITGGLEHPGIVPVYGLGAYADGRPFYAMRFIKGDSLKEAIERFHKNKGPINAGKRALELRQLLGRFNDVCDAIAYAHSRGVLHRDLKPGNIMLGKYGETLVVDWGLAKPVGGPTSKEADAEEPLRPASGDGSAPTQMGSAIGTPQFMPPEQAAGRLDQLGPASDVYSLGATLYCLLTGKAPFRDPDVGAVLQEVQRGDFPPPRQVHREVHPALDAICLKAMAIRPADRYPTPSALGGDIEKWLADEPVSAWREPWRVRAGRWARRNQTLVAAMAAGLLVAILAGAAGAWWLERQRLETQQAVETALVDVGRLQGQARWGEARAVLDQAKRRLGNGELGDLKAKLNLMRGELDLVERLDVIRLKKAEIVNSHFDIAGTDQGYEEAFRDAGMAEVGGDAMTAAAWVRGSGVREAVIAALDDWAASAEQRERRDWILEVARQADPDPWRDQARVPALREDAATLTKLTGSMEAAKQSPQLLTVLARRLTKLGGNAEHLLREAQERRPEDFWINLYLGNALWLGKKPEEALGYYRAALAVRPGTAAVYNALGNILDAQGRREEAAAEFRRAIALDPKGAVPHNGLGNVLYNQGKQEEAASEYRTAIELGPDLAEPHSNLGNVLSDQGKREAATAEYRKAIELDPKLALAHYGLGDVLYNQGKLEEAAAECRKAIELDPKNALAHSNLGNVLYNQGKREAATAEYRKAIELDPKLALAHSNLGNVLYNQGKLEEAAAECRKAIELDPKLALLHYGLGNVLRDQGKWEEAAAEYRKAIELDPKSAHAHGALGLTLLQLGRFSEARQATQRGLDLLPADEPLRKFVFGQLQTCERMLALDAKLPAILKGEAQPADAAEQVSLAALCSLKKRHADAARFYAEAFVAQPALANDVQTGNRYNAACAATLAAGGQGDDDDKPDDKERARFRHQALDWLRADLAFWDKLTKSGPPQALAAVQQTLRHWQEDSDLASVRDAAALEKLPEAERAALKKLWAEVEDLANKSGEGGRK